MKSPLPQYDSIDARNIIRKRGVTCTGLAGAVDGCLERYFDELGGMTPPPDLHEKIMAQAEKPLIERVLAYVKGNQVRAAHVLGINRNTLRKKIAALEIDVEEVTGTRETTRVVSK